jgi:UDP-2,3-diacylglucosamine pyrophosphatase LpxH
MSQKPIVIIVSDLHLGGGRNDPGDDHIFDQNQFRDFILEHLLASPEGQRGEIEVFINGDFLEFAQVRQSAYQLRSATAWCSERESLEKLGDILEGHADVFAALKRFQESGNTVTIAAGNHDVDLFWPRVQRKLQEKSGGVRFVLGADWCTRFNGQLAIAHGHQYDVANRFQKWNDPFVDGPDGQRRLEMCPGTLFMVKFVNRLEDEYPFADNIKPEGALAGILWREDKLGWVLAGSTLFAFAAKHPLATLGSEAQTRLVSRLLVDAMCADPSIGAKVRGWYRQYLEPNASDVQIDRDLLRPERLDALLAAVVFAEEPSAWQAALDCVSTTGGTLGDNPGTLELRAAQKQNDKELFRAVAKSELANGNTQVVVLGHTHLPDRVEYEGKHYFNPGSWTRYAEISEQEKMTIKDLRNENLFPYRLNYVRVDGRNRAIRTNLETFREFIPRKYPSIANG